MPACDRFSRLLGKQACYAAPGDRRTAERGMAISQTGSQGRHHGAGPCAAGGDNSVVSIIKAGRMRGDVTNPIMTFSTPG
jgi:hypothetical protein